MSRSINPGALTGFNEKGGQSERRVVKSLRLQPEDLEVHVEKLFAKYKILEKELVKYQVADLEGAEVVFVAFGTVARLAREAMEILASQGIKTGLIRPVSLWPFPKEAFDKIDFGTTKVVISTELSMGQMIDDVKMSVNGRLPVELIHRTGGMIPTSLEVAENAKKILGGLK